MKFPQWAPPILLGAVEHYTQVANEGGPEAAQCADFAEMWRRLLTRPEMEFVWPWIINTTGFGLCEYLGFFRQFGSIVEDFHSAPRLSEAAYSAEMREIATMAASLAARIRKFSGTGLGRSPFNSILWPDNKEFELRDQFSESGEFRVFQKMTSEFPTVAQHLDRLEDVARSEERFQYSRLPVSRKSNDFRAYLIREIRNYFLMFPEGHSPSRIATICSVALDDPDITPDLVRALVKRGT